MNNKAFKIAFQYLAQTPEPADPTEKEKSITDNPQELEKFVKGSLKASYPGILNQYLRNTLDISELPTAMYLVATQINGIAQLDNKMNPLKIKMLNAIGEVVVDTNLLSDQVLKHIKDNPEGPVGGWNEDSIGSYIKDNLLTIRKNCITSVRKIKNLIGT